MLYYRYKSLRTPATTRDSSLTGRPTHCHDESITSPLLTAQVCCSSFCLALRPGAPTRSSRTPPDRLIGWFSTSLPAVRQLPLPVLSYLHLGIEAGARSGPSSTQILVPVLGLLLWQSGSCYLHTYFVVRPQASSLSTFFPSHWAPQFSHQTPNLNPRPAAVVPWAVSSSPYLTTVRHVDPQPTSSVPEGTSPSASPPPS